MPSSEGLSEARMITTVQAKEYLESVGITLPDFILQALLEQADSIQECLDAHYPPATALLIQSYLLGLMALGQGDKYISSQTGPNGASRSFRYLSFADRWKASLGLLRGLDKYGCATSLIPPDPTNTAFAGIWIARGGCMCNGSR
uniref:Head to tail adaptor n=2 Tax=root TaxID=1 RepID=A0A8S5R4F6_9CAUD|nr:MAG TPA: head to tail adaptor [Siphoviridae sp. ctby413]